MELRSDFPTDIPVANTMAKMFIISARMRPHLGGPPPRELKVWRAGRGQSSHFAATPAPVSGSLRPARPPSARLRWPPPVRREAWGRAGSRCPPRRPMQKSFGKADPALLSEVTWSERVNTLSCNRHENCLPIKLAYDDRCAQPRVASNHRGQDSPKSGADPPSAGNIGALAAGDGRIRARPWFACRMAASAGGAASKSGARFHFFRRRGGLPPAPVHALCRPSHGAGTLGSFPEI